MSRIDLEKRAEKVRIVLEKRALPQPPATRVGVALDISGSARPLYKSGIIQETVSRLMAVSLRFDDNGQLDAWAFDNGFHRLPEADADNYESFVAQQIVDNARLSKWGGTRYAPVMSDVVDKYFGAAPAQAPKGLLSKLFGRPAATTAVGADRSSPALNLFVTDGANSDRTEAERVMRQAQRYPLYWQLVGVGNPDEFEFLEKMADDLPNVGFVHLPSLDISDDTLYERLLSDELCAWLKKL